MNPVDADIDDSFSLPFKLSTKNSLLSMYSIGNCAESEYFDRDSIV